MPVMDGMECTQKIRQLEAERELVEHVPIIGVTANARKEQIEALFKAGMVSCRRTADLLIAALFADFSIRMMLFQNLSVFQNSFQKLMSWRQDTQRAGKLFLFPMLFGGSGLRLGGL